KLRRRFDDDGVVEEQLQRLVQENLQSDARFAESFVRQRIGRGFGPLRIAQDARRKGISGELYAAALSAEDVDWYALAGQVLRKKFGEIPATQLKERARRARFMQYRGFSSEHYQHLFEETD
ncbi:MAG: regulatory protein RecX, partial [Halioglobus sp.]|nr:regulatory protein RecX [Halioglobus sp.]